MKTKEGYSKSVLKQMDCDLKKKQKMLSNFNLSAQSGKADPCERMTSMTRTIADIVGQR